MGLRRCLRVQFGAALVVVALYGAAAFATPTSLSFTGIVTSYEAGTASEPPTPDPSRVGQPFYAWVILDLPPPETFVSGDGTVVEARAQSRRGCEVLVDGVCESDLGAAPSLVTGYVINLPWETDTAYPASAYLGEVGDRLNLRSPPSGPGHIDLYLITLFQYQTIIAGDERQEVRRIFMLNPATFETDDLFLSVLDYTLPPNPAAFPNCCLFFSDTSDAGSRRLVGTITSMVPEPTSVWLLGLGLAAMAIARRRVRCSKVGSDSTFGPGVASRVKDFRR